MNEETKPCQNKECDFIDPISFICKIWSAERQAGYCKHYRTEQKETPPEEYEDKDGFPPGVPKPSPQPEPEKWEKPTYPENWECNNATFEIVKITEINAEGIEQLFSMVAELEKKIKG